MDDELEALRAALKARDEAHQTFLYRASHDLREPLRKIAAFSDLLKQDLGADLPEAAAEDLGYILDASRRMQEMLDGLLVLSRLHQRTLALETVSARACAEQALRQVGAETLAVSWEPLPTLRTDPSLLTDCYRRILENALQYARPEGPLEVLLTAEERADAWVLGVHDNGVGIAERFAERVFLPFERLERRTAGSGPGMGLAIVQKQLGLLGGRAWVEPGQAGAHLRFSLPTSAASRP